MDEMIRAISLAHDEPARRAILNRHSGSFPRLLEPPAFPDNYSANDPALVRRDYLLFAASLSAFEHSGLLLMRCIYTGEFGPELGAEDLGYAMIGIVASLELADTHWRGGPPFWTSISFGVLPHEAIEALDERIIEHERNKS